MDNESLKAAVIAVQGRNRAAQQQNGIGESKIVPDRELVATLVEYGQPMWSATGLAGNPSLRAAAMRFWLDVQDANEGNTDARMRIDYVRASWGAMRKAGMVHDLPGMVSGDILDPKDLL